MRHKVQVFSIPGQNPLLENILNDSNCDVLEKKIQYNAVSLSYQVYLEWEDRSDEYMTYEREEEES